MKHFVKILRGVTLEHDICLYVFVCIFLYSMFCLLLEFGAFVERNGL